MMCWYCEHETPPEITAVYERYQSVLSERALDFGPAHIVWGDSNFDDASIHWCLSDLDDDGLTGDEIAVVAQSLRDLLAIPEAVRVPSREVER